MTEERTPGVNVVLQMTGLLLLSRGPGSGAPMYVLAPATHGPGMEHRVEIGFIGRPGDEVDQDGIHWKDVTDLSITLGQSGNAPNPNLPPGNVSTSAGSRVHREHYGPKRRPELKARVILNEGSVTDTCALGLFNLAGEGEIPLSNVVEWTYPLRSGTSLRLEGRKMLPNGEDPPQEIRTLDPTGNTIELFLRHIPDVEPTEPGPGEEPAHWRMFFHLLHPHPSKDEVPRFVRRTGAPCRWRGTRSNQNVGTLSCPVGKGDPPA